MARFSFRVGTVTGAIRTLEAEGLSREAARRSLETQGLFVFEAGGQAEVPARARLAVPGRDRIDPRTLLVFNQELLALVKAGLPILTVLDLLRDRTRQGRLRILLDDVREAVKGGASLSAALARHPRVFSPLYTAALHAGEQSGNFVDALTRYVEYQKRMLSLRQRLRAALSYPAVLALASLAVILFLLTFVVPAFTRIYGNMEAQLPVATRLLEARVPLMNPLLWGENGLGHGRPLFCAKSPVLVVLQDLRMCHARLSTMNLKNALLDPF